MLQITPQGCGSIENQLLISGREQRNLQLAIFEIPPADNGFVHKYSGTDDSGEVVDVPHMSFGQEQAFRFLVAQQELVKTSKEQTTGKIVSRQTIVNVEIGLAIKRGFADWKLLQPGLDLGLGGAKEIGGILNGGGAEVREIPPCQFNPGWFFCHGFKGGAKLICFLFLHFVAEPTYFTQRTDRAAPGIKQALAFALGHPGFLADGFQGFPFVNSLGNCLYDEIGKVCLAVSGNIRIRFQGIHRAEIMRPTFVEEQGKIIHREQVHGTPVRPAFNQTLGIDFVAADGQTVECMTEKAPAHRKGLLRRSGYRQEQANAVQPTAAA